ncbi:hypothetical protein CFC21_070360 [Triticum aestivum]|uniref:Ubiquitin-related modifier 1 n=2 Tax=Triticum aestivum TaxID=4565 RepID=A0A3B6LHJ4_WHEAT|nr:uncharacterized protein LOC123115799 [Triticum aestivum]KAF7063895.1 hypothetical protein CFC21_070360 [Triticum aestivum]
MHLTLEFGGGLELLLEKSTKVHKVDVQPRDGEDKATMKGLLSWVKSNLIKERPEMFMKDNSVYGFSFFLFHLLVFWRKCLETLLPSRICAISFSSSSLQPGAYVITSVSQQQAQSLLPQASWGRLEMNSNRKL